MKKILVLLFATFLIQSHIHAQSNDPLPLFEKNYIQIDPFYLDYETVSATNTQYNENNEQLMTSRPSILFYFNVHNFIFRPFISLNPTLSTNQGSLAAGYLFNQTCEFGLYTLLNHTEKVEGKESTQNGVIQSQFLLGPYFVFYPYVGDRDFMQVYSRLAYQYSQKKDIISGATSNISEQKGVNFNVSLLYSIKISEKVYFSPNTNFTYFATNDFGGASTMRDGYELQFMPISFQILI